MSELTRLEKYIAEKASKDARDHAEQTNKDFTYTYTRPSLDWFESVNVTIKNDDYMYFELQRRYGPSWWLIGLKQIDNPYGFERIEIGQIPEAIVSKFIDWTKTGNGNRITTITAISGSFDIFKEISNIKLGDKQ